MDFENINLGAIERPKDERDFPLDEILGAIPAPTRPDRYVPEAIDQFKRNWQQQQPACGAHGGAHLKMLLDMLVENVVARKTPNYGWVKLKDPNSPVKDGYPIESGTDMRSVFKWLKNLGAADFEPLENHAELTLPEYADPSRVTTDMDANAAGSKIGSYAFGNTDFDSLCQQIWQAKAVAILAKVDEGFWHTTTPTFTTPKWGHFIVAYGYTPDGIWVIDSADPDDANAFKFIAKEYIQPQFIYESGTAVDLPPSVHDALTQGQKETALQILSNMAKILELDLEWIGRQRSQTATSV